MDVDGQELKGEAPGWLSPLKCGAPGNFAMGTQVDTLGTMGNPAVGAIENRQMAGLHCPVELSLVAFAAIITIRCIAGLPVVKPLPEIRRIMLQDCEHEVDTLTSSPVDSRPLPEVTLCPCAVRLPRMLTAPSDVDLSSAMSPGISACFKSVIASFDLVIDCTRSSGVTFRSPLSDSPYPMLSSPTIGIVVYNTSLRQVVLRSGKIALRSCFCSSIFTTKTFTQIEVGELLKCLKVRPQRQDIIIELSKLYGNGI